MSVLTREEAQQVLGALECKQPFLKNALSSYGISTEEIESKAIELLRARLAEKEQEPVAWISKHGVVYPLDAKDEVNPVNELQPLYTAPPQREWQGLTDEEMVERANAEYDPENFARGVAWASLKLKEKNGHS